ncbi:stalk domain-containing protein [Lysinibacillus sp. NPDC098008]|uniref:stalk domain-containing protein n=1 Tax=Lysinibacillus sp. NPDC098008 TaxID=3364146 RepID=UPI00380C24E5
MKKPFIGIFTVCMLLLWASPADAAAIQIKIDHVLVKSDVAPEMTNNRTMVPLRVISENLGAQVHWQDAKIILTSDKTVIQLQPNSHTIIKNGQTAQLDVQPYIKNNRTFVPLRFIAETFGSQVHYSNGIVSITNEPLLLNNIKIQALRYEYHMTMGGVVQDIQGNAYVKELSSIFQVQRGTQVEAPAHYSWQPNTDQLGSYSKQGQYNFRGVDGQNVQQFDIYLLNRGFPIELLEGYPTVLLHDVTADKWHIFTEKGMDAIDQLIHNAINNGFSTVISNTVA